MPTPGKGVLKEGGAGRGGILSSGKLAIYSESGECSECCGTTPVCPDGIGPPGFYRDTFDDLPFDQEWRRSPLQGSSIANGQLTMQFTTGEGHPSMWRPLQGLNDMSGVQHYTELEVVDFDPTGGGYGSYVDLWGYIYEPSWPTYLGARIFAENRTQAATKEYLVIWFGQLQGGSGQFNTGQAPLNGDVMRLEINHDTGNDFTIRGLVNGIEVHSETVTLQTSNSNPRPCQVIGQISSRGGSGTPADTVHVKADNFEHSISNA